MDLYTKGDSMPTLNAREQIVIHEWMHVNLVGFKKMCTLTLMALWCLIPGSQFLAMETRLSNIDDMDGETPMFPDKAVRFLRHIHLVAAKHDAMDPESVWRLPASRLGLEIYQGERK
jgi:hypothetical protein